MRVFLILLYISTLGHFGFALLEGFEFIDDVVVEIRNSSDSSATLNFLYYEGDNLTVSAKIIDKKEIVINGTVNSLTKTGFVVLSATDLTTLEYGAYHLIFTVESEQGEAESTDLVLFYEEEISGFGVVNKQITTLTEHAVQFQSIIETGSNLDVEWFVHGNISHRINSAYTNDNVSTSYTYYLPNDYNITVVARNALNEVYQTDVIVTVVYPVEGFFMNVSKICPSVENCVTSGNSVDFVDSLLSILVTPGDEISANIYLDSLVRLPIGNITVTINYDNNTMESMESIFIQSDFELLFEKGLSFTHTYLEQGDYRIKVTVESELSTQYLYADIHVWEDFRNLSLSLSTTLARVYEDIDFNFAYVPRKGFQYVIQYADNSTKEGASNLFYSDYNQVPWKYSYFQDGVYLVELYAWNPFYVLSLTYEIRIQFPIPDLIIFPPLEDPPVMFPIPDGLVNYRIRMVNDDPSPTNVTCYYNFDPNAPLKNRSVIIKYGGHVTEWKKHETEGLKNISIVCENEVSNYYLETKVYMQPVELTDFVFEYQRVLGMNNTIISPPAATEIEIEDVPVSVEFKVSIFDCVRFPFGTTMKYNFGDGTAESDFNSFDVFEHTYNNRGEYDISIIIKNSTTSISVYQSIKIGVVDFSVDAYLGSVDLTEFTFNMSGMDYGTYELDVGDGNEYFSTDNYNQSSLIGHIYTRYGGFHAKLVASNLLLKEVLYLPHYILVDYNISTLSIHMPAKIDMPPGNVTVQIVSISSYPFVTCEFEMNDLIKRGTYKQTANITMNEPMTYDFTYMTLGNRTVTVHCENLYDKKTLTTTVNVWNECFTINGMFDRQYSNDSNPMRVFTSIDFDLVSRMAVFCSDQRVVFQWTLYTVNETHEEFFPYNPLGTPRGSIRFARGSVPANLYKVALNVTLQNTWLYEPTYVMFVKSPPFAYIEGGYQRNVRVLLKNITLNAIDVSYDPEKGIGGNEDLQFEWSCQRKTVKSLDELENSYTESPEKFKDCNDLLTEISSGISDFVLLDQINQGYVITVNVLLEDMSTSFTQLIYGVFGNPPSMDIKCYLNCNTKYAVMLKSDWDGLCSDCEVDEDISYEWFMDVKTSLGTWVEFTNFRFSLETDVHARSLVLSPNVLETNMYYRLAVKTKGYGRIGIGEARIIFVTNMAPYNGTCRAQPLTGFALTTLFAISCIDWRDEGAELDQVSERDYLRNNPLMYEYAMSLPTIGLYGDIEYFNSPLVKSGEMTATELRLPAGSPALNYRVGLVVKVLDKYGDYTEYHMNITVMPDENMKPQNEDDIERINNLLDESNYTFSITDAGGNDMGLMRVVSSTVSSYSGLNMPVLDSASDLSSPDDILQYGNETESEVQTVLKEKTSNFVNEIAHRIPDGKKKIELLPADVILVGKSLEKCIEKTGLVTETTSEIVVESGWQLLKNIRKHTKTKPFPMSELEGIQQSTAEIIGLLSSNLNIYQTAGDEDVNKTLTVEDVEMDLRTYHAYHREEFEKFIAEKRDYKKEAKKLYGKRLEIRKRKKKISGAAKKVYKKLFDAIDEAFNITSSTVAYEEPVKTIQRPNVNVSLEKNNINHFRNMSVIQRDGFAFDFNNETLENVTASSIQLKVAIFKKSPMLFAQGAANIKGSIIKVEALDNKDESVEFPVTMTINNEGVSFYKEYKPIKVEGSSPSMMYFRCLMTDSNDALITYIKPEGVDLTQVDANELYMLYARSAFIPSEGVNDFKYKVKATDWESNGFKIFIPPGSLKNGDAYIALKSLTDIIPSQNSTLLSRKRRSTDNTTSEDDQLLANISLAVVTTGCRVYNPEREAWESNGCSVLPFSTLNETVCRCLPGTGSLFASTFAIPNMIDFDAVWSKFDITNASVYGSLIAVIVFYLIFACILRRLDNKDLFECVPTFLSDNDIFDTHFYMITVQTGLRVGSGTQSNIGFILSGSDGDTGVRNLTDGTTKEFKKNSTQNFIVGTPGPIGDMFYLRIWHDNSGEGKYKSWFLHRAVITDLQTNEKFIFVCDRWLASDLDDGMIERIIPVLNDRNSGFENSFSHMTRVNVTENHLWLSLVLRPPYTAFTRVQRLSCILVLLLMTMISNAMFFQTKDETEVTADTVRLGNLSFSFKTLYVSFIGAVITVPPIFILTFLFRNTRRQKKQKPEKEKNSDHEESDPFANAEMNPMMLFHQKCIGPKDEIIYYQHAKFPPFVKNIAWVISLLACAASAFFLILYSMEWGKDKSEEWLTTFLLSFVESVLIVDPVKVFMVAFLIAVILRNQKDDQELHIDLKSVLNYSQRYAGHRTETFRDLKMAVTYKEEIVKAEERKQQRTKEKTAKEAFIKVVVHVLFVVVLFVVSYVNRDQRSFLIKTHLENQLYASSKYQFGFSKVTSAEAFFEWNTKTMLPFFFPTSDYNGESISIRDKFFLADMTNVKIGLIRLRQVRVKQDICYGLPDLFRGHYCGRTFSNANEDKAEFCVGCARPLTLDSWKHISAKQIWGIPLTGHFNTYSGGGFIQNLHNTKENTQFMLDELVENMWIDRFTRAVFLEFTTYNANTNLLCYSVFLAEFLETGGGDNWVDTQCFRPSLFSDATGLFSILFYCVFVIILLYRTKLLVKNLHLQKCQFVKSFWNIIDTFICLFGYAGVAVWAGKFIYTKRALNMYFEDKNIFINFQHIVIWEYVFNIILGVLVFISTLRIMSALEYNKRMTALADILRHGGSDIFKMFLLVFLGITGFAFLGYLLFGSTVYEYRNMFITFGSLTNTLIGRNSLSSMIAAAPTFAEVYFFVYAFFIIFTLLTMFAAVLNDTIEKVRLEQQQTPDVIGLMDVIKGSMKDMLGLFGVYVKQKNSNDSKVEGETDNIDSTNVLKLMRNVIFDDQLLKKQPSYDIPTRPLTARQVELKLPDGPGSTG